MKLEQPAITMTVFFNGLYIHNTYDTSHSKSVPMYRKQRVIIVAVGTTGFLSSINISLLQMCLNLLRLDYVDVQTISCFPKCVFCSYPF